jgi:hypothetical protein
MRSPVFIWPQTSRVADRAKGPTVPPSKPPRTGWSGDVARDRALMPLGEIERQAILIFLVNEGWAGVFSKSSALVKSALS